ncbi:MAG: CDP-diacylglycerol--serine O-phosphatidyltransferase [Bacteroidota bacterium]|jgi:CDP-diacylglycerol--serine O-phosphatidyltransferase
MKKQIPNLFTLANLFLGCMAIVQIMQTGLSLSVDASGENLVEIPEQIYLASILIAAAAVVDFFDGFVARLLKVPSEMGKQLDSLADVVSFGVAPGLIIYQFLRLSFAQHDGGLDISSAFLLPAFLVPCAGAYRLARFNIDTEQSYGFKGVPIPAAGIWVASFPLVYWFAKDQWVIDLLRSYWFWYAVIGLSSYLMISTLPMMAMKFKEFSIKALLPFIIIAIVSLVSAVVFGWLAVSIGFIAYVILSLLYK